MRQDGNLLFGIGAAGCAILLVAHFCGSDSPRVARDGIATPSRNAPSERVSDDEKWEEWRRRRSPEITDSHEQRAEKEFSATMRAHRQQPVEIVDDPSRGAGLVEIATMDDLRRLLEQGGSYAGPLPAEVESEGDAEPAPTTGGNR